MIQISASRMICAVHHQSVQRLLKSVGKDSYSLLPSRTISIFPKSNLHYANLKEQDSSEKSIIPYVASFVSSKTFQYDKYEYFTKSDEKSNSCLAFQKSNNLSVDEKRLNEIHKLVQSNRQDQAQSNDSDPLNRASPEQVEDVAKVLRADLPKLFAKPMDYKIYSKHLEFENHLTNTHTRTLLEYSKQLALLKIAGHLKYAYVECQVLKLTTHHSEGTIKVRWRIRGVSGVKVFMNFWRMKVWKLKDTVIKDAKSWYEGFSIFYVKGDGLVHKHVVLKMQPDEDYEVETSKPKLVDITAKVA
uniref:Uncharacterized protein C6orf136 homolog n=1 Tax=Cacopsylla melanoneura TaxID=428564 RepID=A0A8D8QYT6_9HEMI